MDHRGRGQRPPEAAMRKERALVSRQFGLILRNQALAAGFTSRNIEGKLRRSEWKALYRGVYADTSFPSSWRQAVLAAIFRAGPGTAASGTCAAALLDLPGFHRGSIEVTGPHHLRNAPFVARIGSIPEDHRTRIGSIPCTNAARTLLDIAGRVGRIHLEDALDDALRRRLTSLPRLKWMVNGVSGRGRPGIAVLRDAIKERDDGRAIPESVLESRLWRPLGRLGVARPERQFPIVYEGTEYRLDYAFPHAMVAVEAQSYRWHSSKSAWERDMEKANVLQILGWRPIYVTWADLHDRKRTVFHQLRRLLLPTLFDNS